MHRTLGLTWIGAHRRGTVALDEALAAIESAADPTAADTGPAQAAGMLHLTAALCDARQGKAGDADDHLGAAKDLARRTGERNALHHHFGSANVATWEVNVAVELGRGPEVAEKITPHLR